MLSEIYRYIMVKFVFFCNFIFKRKNIKPKDFKNVLLIHNQLIGDVLTATPFIREFRKKFPEAVITMVVSGVGFEILKKSPYINDFIIFEEQFLSFRDFRNKYAKLTAEIKKRKPDLVIDFQMSFLYFTRLLIGLKSGARNRVSFKRGGFRGFLPTYEVELNAEHLVLQYLSLLCAFDIKEDKNNMEVHFDNDDLRWVDEFFKEKNINPENFTVAVHPGNKNPLKKWKNENFAKLIDYLMIDKKFNVILLGSADDKADIEEIINLAGSKPINSAGLTTLTRLSALISRLNLLISIDTSSIHIASALDISTIGLYGPTDMLYWSAWNRKKQICISNKVICKPCKITTRI